MPFPSSSLTITTSGATINAHPNGRSEATRIGSTFVLGDLEVGTADTSVMGSTVTGPRAYLKGNAFGTIDSSGAFSIPASTPAVRRASFLINAVVDGRQQAFDGINTTALTGTYDEAAGVFTLNGSIEDLGGKARATVHLRLQFVDRPPIARIATPSRAECSGPGVARTHLSSAGTSDPDGAQDLAHFFWTVDPNTANEVSFVGPEAQVDLPLGRHRLRLLVSDTYGRSSTVFADVDAVDTLGPQVTSARVTPSCLWPPNHMLVPYRIPDDVTLVATDVCHPGGETVRVVAVGTDQPANAAGDGNTENDAFLTQAGFCLRSERSGLADEGRTYSITLRAVDRLGNLSADRLTVSAGVAHDRSGAPCPDTAAMVPDGDPRCEPAPVAKAGGALPAALDVGPAVPGSLGCSTSALISWPALFLLALRVRRRSRP